MTPTTQPHRAPTPLDVLLADRDAIEATIVSLRHQIEHGVGRAPVDLRPYLTSAEARLKETVREIEALAGVSG